MKSKIWAAGLALSALALSGPAHASYVVNAVESGGNVIFTGSGSVNLAALSFDSTTAPPPLVAPGAGLLFLGGVSDQYKGISGPVSFGSGALTFNSPASAPGIGLVANSNALLVPFGYTSGTVLGNTTFIFTATNFASLGMATGTYTYNWGAGGTADTYTLNVGSAPSVPEASSWAMMILGLGLAGASLRRSRTNVGVRHQFA